MLEQFRREMEAAIANGDKAMIEITTSRYNKYKAMIEKKYGST